MSINSISLNYRYRSYRVDWNYTTLLIAIFPVLTTKTGYPENALFPFKFIALSFEYFR